MLCLCEILFYSSAISQGSVRHGGLEPELRKLLEATLTVKPGRKTPGSSKLPPRSPLSPESKAALLLEIAQVTQNKLASPSLSVLSSLSLSHALIGHNVPWSVLRIVLHTLCVYVCMYVYMYVWQMCVEQGLGELCGDCVVALPGEVPGARLGLLRHTVTSQLNLLKNAHLSPYSRAAVEVRCVETA